MHYNLWQHVAREQQSDPEHSETVLEIYRRLLFGQQDKMTPIVYGSSVGPPPSFAICVTVICTTPTFAAEPNRSTTNHIHLTRAIVTHSRLAFPCNLNPYNSTNTKWTSSNVGDVILIASLQTPTAHPKWPLSLWLWLWLCGPFDINSAARIHEPSPYWSTEVTWTPVDQADCSRKVDRQRQVQLLALHAFSLPEFIMGNLVTFIDRQNTAEYRTARTRFWQYGTLKWDEFYKHLDTFVITVTTTWSNSANPQRGALMPARGTDRATRILCIALQWNLTIAIVHVLEMADASSQDCKQRRIVVLKLRTYFRGHMMLNNHIPMRSDLRAGTIMNLGWIRGALPAVIRDQLVERAKRWIFDMIQLEMQAVDICITIGKCSDPPRDMGSREAKERFELTLLGTPVCSSDGDTPGIVCLVVLLIQPSPSHPKIFIILFALQSWGVWQQEI
ncbi:hypothetical protein BU15DRAFT_63452 [Melanogaster broomeanus]|nr:hypothetical protein BU15DRAFT_63452 [Melanogaster broomeanus]